MHEFKKVPVLIGAKILSCSPGETFRR